MRTKGKKLKWFVLNHDFNNDEPKMQNIFYDGFPEELRKEIKRRKISNEEELKEYLKRWSMYHYWSKTEAEIVVGGLHSSYKYDHKLQLIKLYGQELNEDLCNKLYNIFSKDYMKIDMWYQIEPNLDIITKYVMNELCIKFKNKELVEDE